MPASPQALARLVTVPHSEAAMHAGIAGRTLLSVEEDLYVNGETIPQTRRFGCIVFTGSSTIALHKSEAGWQDSEPRAPHGDLALLRTTLIRCGGIADGEAVDAYNLLSHVVRGVIS